MSMVQPETPRPPRPPNAYIIFRQFLNEYIAAHPDYPDNLTQQSISKLSSLVWRYLDYYPAVKDFFYKLSDEAARKHKEAYPNYRYSPKRKEGPRNKPSPRKARHQFSDNKPGRESASSKRGTPQMTSAGVSKVLDSVVPRIDLDNPSLPPRPSPPPTPFTDMPFPAAYESPVSYIHRPRPYAPPLKWSRPIYCIPIPYQTQSPTASASNGSAASTSPVNMGPGPAQADESMVVDHEENSLGARDYEAEAQSSGSSDSGEDNTSSSDEEMEQYFDFSEYSME